MTGSPDTRKVPYKLLCRRQTVGETADTSTSEDYLENCILESAFSRVPLCWTPPILGPGYTDFTAWEQDVAWRKSKSTEHTQTCKQGMLNLYTWFLLRFQLTYHFSSPLLPLYINLFYQFLVTKMVKMNCFNPGASFKLSKRKREQPCLSNFKKCCMNSSFSSFSAFLWLILVTRERLV